MTNGPSKEFGKRLNARKIDFWLDSDAQPVTSLADRIYSQLMKKRVWINRREPEKRLRHLRMLLLNLYAAASADPARYVSLSLNKNDYSLHTRYEPQFRSYEIVDRLIEGLGADCLGYVEKNSGWQDRATGKGYWTRIRATRALQKLFKEVELHPWMISKTSNAEVIRLKDRKQKAR